MQNTGNPTGQDNLFDMMTNLLSILVKGTQFADQYISEDLEAICDDTLREYAEGCHISEIGFFVKEAQIALIGFPVSDHPGGRLHIRRN